MLIIFSGPPGAGKTTIARALARELGAVYVRIDTAEQSIRASGMLKDEVGPAGYMVGYGVAADNLALGNTVVADSVNSLKVTRDAWLAVAERAGMPAVEVEIICSDKAEHRRRAETRPSDVEGLVKPSWNEIAARHYEPWERRPFVIDTATRDVENSVAAIDRARARRLSADGHPLTETT